MAQRFRLGTRGSPLALTQAGLVRDALMAAHGWDDVDIVVVSTTGARVQDRALAEIVMELGSIAAVKGHVRSGVGVALVSEHAVKTDVALGRLVIVRDRRTPIARPIHLVHRGLDRLPPAAAALRERMLAKPARVADPES